MMDVYTVCVYLKRFNVSDFMLNIKAKGLAFYVQTLGSSFLSEK